jgi:hypothetical protein
MEFPQMQDWLTPMVSPDYYLTWTFHILFRRGISSTTAYIGRFIGYLNFPWHVGTDRSPVCGVDDNDRR